MTNSSEVNCFKNSPNIDKFNQQLSIEEFNVEKKEISFQNFDSLYKSEIEYI